MVHYHYSLRGGYLTAIEHDGKDIMYHPDPRSWSGTDVAIFPFVARLKDGKYTVDGKEYMMKNHGLARYNDFRLVEEDDHHTILEFDSSEETRKQYPYDFAFQVKYERSEDGLTVTHTAINTDTKDIHFGMGAHPSFRLPSVEKETETDISGNAVEFDEEVDLTRITFDPEYKFITGEEAYGKVRRIELSKEFFRNCPTFLFRSGNIRAVTLYKKDGSQVRMAFSAPYMAFWSHPEFGDYVCIEPWMSLPDFLDGDRELSKKKTLLTLKPGESVSLSYHLEFREEK